MSSKTAPPFAASLGAYQAQVDAALAEMDSKDIINRIWAYDHTVWRPDPEEIANRLGWLDIAVAMQPLYTLDNEDSVGTAQARAWSTVGTIKGLVDAVRAEGYTHALLLGMGGSSLAPEVFRLTYGVADGYLDLAVLDSTDPGAVLHYDRQLDPAKTLYIVSTKSGGTVETLSFFKYFYNRTIKAVGRDAAGQHFIAITDPGSKLEALAKQYDFRATFLNDADIGGRYSALSYFGLVPAALVGVDVPLLLYRAMDAAVVCRLSASQNAGAWLGAIMGELAKAGRDKLTLMTSPLIASFGDWVEQLIAESTGKEGKGILPVVGEPPGEPGVYGDDRLFICLRAAEDDTYTEAINALEEAGHPVVRLELGDLYDLGGQYFLWEFAVAVAGYCLDIQPFDQPNVESAKNRAREKVDAYTKSGELPRREPLLSEDGITVYGSVEGDDLKAVLNNFLAQAATGDYISLQAYLTPDDQTEAALQAIRLYLRAQHRLATTIGYGPRFLHSTGQLHKGDGGNGLFIQITADAAQDVAIPDEAGQPGSAMTFGILKQAQAMGDREALLENDRRVLTLHLGAAVASGLQAIQAAL